MLRARHFRFLAAREGRRFRLVSASSFNSDCVIDFAMLRDAPRRLAFERSPRLAESAAPAAICCFLDFAGM
jgi:hypothetical protein